MKKEMYELLKEKIVMKMAIIQRLGSDRDFSEDFESLTSDVYTLDELIQVLNVLTTYEEVLREVLENRLDELEVRAMGGE